jgi:hypothetical protein
MTLYGELVQIMATTLSKESPFLSRSCRDFLYSYGLFVLDKQTSGLCVVAQYHSLHQVENYEYNCGKADILAGVPGYECLPHKSVVGTVWQLLTWFLDAFVKCTLHAHLSLFLTV